MGFDLKEYKANRDKAFIAFVMQDDWNAIKEYCTNYCVAMPDNPDVLAAGVYKAVQEVPTLPDEVKVKAAIKCMNLGFTPFMCPYEPKEG